MGSIDPKKVWTGCCIVPPVVFLIAVGPPAILIVMVLVATVFGLREFYRLALPGSTGLEQWVGTGLALLLSLVSSQSPPELLAPFLALLLLFLSIFFMGISRELSTTVSKIGLTFLGIFYVGFLLSHVCLVRNMVQGRHWVLFLIATVWAGDISALLSGSFLGRHKLYPKISPNKTVEGLGGAVVGSILVACTFAWLFMPAMETLPCILLATGLAVFGQLGDFTESMLKRSARVKDSGSLFPGHGGMLDRLDSFLFSAPFLYYVLLCFTREPR